MDYWTTFGQYKTLTAKRDPNMEYIYVDCTASRDPEAASYVDYIGKVESMAAVETLMS